jgi:hypothetical protein
MNILRIQSVLVAALFAGIVGCGENLPTPRPGTPAGPSHNGSLLPIPGDLGYVEIVNAPLSTKTTESQIGVYFYEKDAKTPVSSPPGDVKLTLELPKGNADIVLKPDPKNPGGFQSARGDHGRRELIGKLEFTLGGKPIDLRIMTR